MTAIQCFSDFRSQDVYADVVLSAYGDDDVGKTFGRLDEEFVHRLDERAVVPDRLVKAAAAFDDVPADDADKAFIGIGIDEDLDIHRVAQFGVGEHQDAFHDEHLGGMHGDRLLAAPAGDVRIGRHRDGLTLFEAPDMVNHQRELNRGRVVEVDALLLLLRQVAVVAVIRVLRQHTDVMFGELVDNFLHHGCFSRAGAAGDT